MSNIETDRIEYKEQLTDNINSLEKPVIAFLNSKGGTLYFGINDDGEAVGIANEDMAQQAIANRISDVIRPATGGLIDISTEKREGKTIIAVNVAMGFYTPYYLDKQGRTPRGCFYRLGSTSREMPEDMIERIMVGRHLPSLVGMQASNQDLAFRQLKIFYESKNLPLSDNFGTTLSFYTGDGKYNRLADMFADENAVSIRVAKWNGVDKSELIQNEEFGRKCLLTAMEAVTNRLNAENITMARKAIPQRIEKNYIDKDILKEAIINAFAHNDYTGSNTPIFEIYDDRFEITTYGDLLAWISEDEFFAGTSRPRNPEIMNIFQNMGYVERLGSGIPNIVKAFGREAFNFSRSVTRISLKFDKSMAESKVESKAESKVESKVEILKLMKSNPAITVAELAKALGLSEGGIEKNIRQLRTDNKVARTGSTKKGRWEVLGD